MILEEAPADAKGEVKTTSKKTPGAEFAAQGRRAGSGSKPKGSKQKTTIRGGTTLPAHAEKNAEGKRGTSYGRNQCKKKKSKHKKNGRIDTRPKERPSDRTYNWKQGHETPREQRATTLNTV